MRVVRGKAVLELEPGSFATLLARHGRVLVDVGAGDGRFVYDQARQDPSLLAVAIEPVAEAMVERSSKAARKPAKGGAPNALFAVAALESLPEELSGIADVVTVNYPWGSLMEAVLGLNPPALEQLARIGRPGARVIVHLNASIFEDPAYLQRLGGLPIADQTFVDQSLVPAFAAAGLDLVSREHIAGDPPHRTSWGQHLVRGSKRSTLLIEARVTPR